MVWKSNDGASTVEPPTAGPDPAGKGDRAPRLQHRRILAVVNPVAGPRGSQRAVKDLVERAEKLGVELDVVETRPDLHGDEAVASRPGRYDCYLAMGGDGTVMDVAEAAMKNGVPMAILPRGTANAVAWHFGLPFDVTRALKVATQGRPVKIDVARTPHRDFLLVAGLGYDAHVIRDATRVLKRRFGFLAYLYAAFKNFGRRPYSFRISLDDEEPFRVRGAMAVVANIGTLAGNIRLVRHVSPVDGRLDVVVVSPANFGAFFRMVFFGILGRLHEDPRVHYYQASRIRMECRPSGPLEIDGNGIEGMHREMTVEILPQALTVMVPPEGMWKVPWMPEVSWSPSLPKNTFAGGKS
jgi:YegS/Rv2252/BmrU family lipid kinase